MVTTLQWAGPTLAEWNKGVLRPVTKEPFWHEPVRLLPIPRYETSSEPVPRVKNCTAYDCSADQQREARLLSLTGWGLSTYHRYRCSLSQWYPARQPLGCPLPDFHNI